MVVSPVRASTVSLAGRALAYCDAKMGKFEKPERAPSRLTALSPPQGHPSCSGTWRGRWPQSGLSDTRTPALERRPLGIIRDARPVVHQDAEIFAGLKPRDVLRGNGHRGARFGVATQSGLTRAHAKAPKTPQFDVVSRLEGVHDALPEQRDNAFRLQLRELQPRRQLVHEFRFRHRVLPRWRCVPLCAGRVVHTSSRGAYARRGAVSRGWRCRAFHSPCVSLLMGGSPEAARTVSLRMVSQGAC